MFAKHLASVFCPILGLVVFWASGNRSLPGQPVQIDSPGSPTQYGEFGCSVTRIPDATGDGYDDLAIGARSENSGAGRVYLCNGRNGKIYQTINSPNPKYIPSGAGSFGIDISGVPDVNGDGRGDIVIGAPGEDVAGSPRGRVYIYDGSGGSLIRAFIPPVEVATMDGFGSKVEGLRDVNGDGRGDIAIGAAGTSTPGLPGGRVYVFSGNSGALLLTLASPNPETDSSFGCDLAGTPSIDGVGTDGLIIGAMNETPISNREGRCYVFNPVSGVLIHTLVSPIPGGGARFGIAVAGVPDASGDGRGDILVADAYGIPRAFEFDGATGSLLQTIDLPLSFVPWHNIAGIPDVNGDGVGDLMFGADREPAGPLMNAGKVFVYDGASSGTLLQTLSPPIPFDDGHFGSAVGALNDVDGDGLAELAVGALGEDTRGRAWLYVVPVNRSRDWVLFE